MTSWSEGYVTDIPYTVGFYREQAPAHLSFVQLMSGQRPRRVTTYCELGCGHGLTVTTLAAANPGISFFATDFNPEQIRQAQYRADAAGLSNLRLFDDSFEKFSAHPDIPETFDVIALHGIYSWVNPEVRQHIRAFLATRLAVGGIVYISYNTLPGWAAFMPLRRLLQIGSSRERNSLQRVEDGISFAKKLVTAQSGYSRGNPAIAQRLEKIAGMQRPYLAHEYLNEAWQPFYFSELAAELAECKLQFVGSASVLDHIDVLNLTPDQQALLGSIENPMIRQETRDFLVNQQFRRDVFVRGPAPVSPREADEMWRGLKFVLVTLPDQITLKVTTTPISADLQEQVYLPIIAALARQVRPISVDDLLQQPGLAAIGFPAIRQALTILVGMAHIVPVSEAETDAMATSAQALNGVLFEEAKAGPGIQFLAGSAAQTGVALDWQAQIFAGLCLRLSDAEIPAAFIDVLTQLGKRVSLEGRVLVDDAEAQAEVRRRYALFKDQVVPLLHRTGTLPAGK